jgi:hypothetical protein
MLALLGANAGCRLCAYAEDAFQTAMAPVHGIHVDSLVYTCV